MRRQGLKRAGARASYFNNAANLGEIAIILAQRGLCDSYSSFSDHVRSSALALAERLVTRAESDLDTKRW